MYIRNLFLALIIIFSSISAKAEVTEANPSYIERLFVGREYVDPWRFHFRLSFGFPAGETEHFSNGAPDPTVISTDKEVFENFYGFEVDFERFITDYFSISAGIGYSGNQADEYTTSNTFNSQISTTSGKLTLIPIETAINFHPAPYGQLDPYIGIGYAYNYVSSSYDKIDANSGGGGLLFRLGLDYWFDKKTSFNLEVKKKYLLIETDRSKLRGRNSTSEQNADPIVIGAGIGYKF